MFMYSWELRGLLKSLGLRGGLRDSTSISTQARVEIVPQITNESTKTWMIKEWSRTVSRELDGCRRSGSTFCRRRVNSCALPLRILNISSRIVTSHQDDFIHMWDRI
jgi:hypothetical protein